VYNVLCRQRIIMKILLKNLILLKCPVCGVKYSADLQRLKHGRQTTCSRKCSYKRRSVVITKKVKLVCCVCKKSFERCPSLIKSKNVFCSIHCKGCGMSTGLVADMRKGTGKLSPLDRKITHTWRCFLAKTLRRLGGRKKLANTLTSCGYSAMELKEHLHGRFKKGMSWGNYGEWEIDHIKPLSAFNRNEDIKIVNALDNLQPLWKEENSKKGSFYEY